MYEELSLFFPFALNVRWQLELYRHIKKIQVTFGVIFPIEPRYSKYKELNLILYLWRAHTLKANIFCQVVTQLFEEDDEYDGGKQYLKLLKDHRQSERKILVFWLHPIA